jgi:outer membrane protein assembly factor BamD (BamD/ComL family)
MTTRHALALLVLAAVTAGCATGSQQTTEGDRPEDRETTTTVQLHTNDAEIRLTAGRDAASRGDYSRALSEFRTVYRNQFAKPEQRAQALYQIALVQSNALYLQRDNQAAVATLRKLLDEFPDSEWRDEAEQMLFSLGELPNR